MNSQDYRSALNGHFDRVYSDHPLPDRATLSKAEEHQCQSIGWTLISWLKEYGPRLLQERELLHEEFKVDVHPSIVFVSTIPGLIAARQILHQRPASICYSAPDDYEAFLAQYPDPDFRWHVIYSSYYTDAPDADTLIRAEAKYPLLPTECYWLHREVSTMAQLFERGGDHLWKWDGQEATLLEEGFSTWIS